MKLLVKEKKGYSFRLLDIDTKEVYRAFQRDFKLKFVAGSLLEISSLEHDMGMITSMKVENEVIGDSSKARIEVDTDLVKVGDLIDGVAVLNLGQVYAKKGKKMAYAYFK
jgi:hypothetical protein